MTHHKLQWTTLIWIGLICFGCHFLGQREEHQEPIPAFRYTSPGRATTLEIEAPFSDLDILVDGLSVFEPLPLPPTDSEEKAIAIFDFLHRSFTTWNAPTGLSVSTQLYGYGYGLCHAQSKLLCALWARYGLSGRIVVWPKHTMAEAKIDGDWQLFDVQHGRDYSRELGQSTSFRDLKRAPERVPAGLDRAGYGHEYLRRLIEEARADHKKTAKPLEKPQFTLAEGKMIIRRRSSQANPPPLSALPVTAPRAHLIPLYEVAFAHRLSNKPWHLPSTLPLLEIDYPEDVPVTIHRKGKRIAVRDARSLNQELAGAVGPWTIAGPPGTEVRLVFCLAGWVGDRVLRAPAGSSIQIMAASFAGTVSFYTPSPPTFRLEALRLQASEPKPRYSVDLVWQDLAPDQQGQLEVNLEELSSALALELYQPLAQRFWVYNGQDHGPSGRTTLSFDVEVPIGLGSPYRPKGEISLFVRLVGNYISSGEGFVGFHHTGIHSVAQAP